MVKSLKDEHPNKNKSRRKTLRIKQSGGVGNSEPSQYLFFLKKLKFDDNVIKILEEIPNQSFQEINDSIVQLLEGAGHNFTTQQLCALLYMLMYKIDKTESFWKKYSFPTIEAHKLSVNEVNKLRFDISLMNKLSNEKIMELLQRIIQKFGKKLDESNNANLEFIENDEFRGISQDENNSEGVPKNLLNLALKNDVSEDSKSSNESGHDKYSEETSDSYDEHTRATDNLTRNIESLPRSNTNLFVTPGSSPYSENSNLLNKKTEVKSAAESLKMLEQYNEEKETDV